MTREICERLGLKAGSKLDFELLPDGTVRLRPADRTALSNMGMLKRPGQRPVSIEEMGEGIAAFVERKARAEAAMMGIDRAMRSVAGKSVVSLVHMQGFHGR